ncbi:putative N-acetyltransferase YhbS [Pseudorhizobium tarimense]|uniref:N-acetyltransferase YhbS n=1 Tax=Pseudorhizobium tarimense TaxID=1079109 RepID=A0ABV2H2V2_9HYPH|nr:GNAT family N-acetyltransferase [Pseudorhizobium tarimense]MCJ8517773.1 GNAT family N-acetyltransferase [Pseudorhizobium tarimense]
MSEIRRITPEDFDQWEALLQLILRSFRYMDGMIDPPSSARRLTLQSLKEKAASEIGFVATTEGELSACIFCRPEPPDVLYIGKLAVLPEMQGRGLGRQLLATAEDVAVTSGANSLRLEARIELADNHATFARWGFVKSAERSHPGYDRVTFIEMVKPLAGPLAVAS